MFTVCFIMLATATLQQPVERLWRDLQWTWSCTIMPFDTPKTTLRKPEPRARESLIFTVYFWQNLGKYILKSCAMRAAIKQAESMERTKWQTVQKKSKTRNTAFKTRHIFDVQINRKNIGTGTVDHRVWIMDQELRAAFGQYIEGWVFFGGA